MHSSRISQNQFDHLFFLVVRFTFALSLILALFAIIPAQTSPNSEQIVIEGIKDGDVFGINKTIVVKGDVAKGVMAFGGDVIVEGRVEGDVATIGGSVLQRENSFIGGDVIVLGGGYHHGKTAPLRNPQSQTIIYAGYEDELREIAQNPALLVAPQFSVGYVVQRILAALFWFVISLALTTVSPGAIGLAIIRLNLNRWQVAIVGILSFVIGTIGVALGLRFLPAPISVGLGLMVTAALLLAYVFGRVSVHAATGKFLQKKIWRDHEPSDSIELLLGTAFWTIILSLPFVWTGAFLGLFVISLGVVLTALAKSNKTWITKKR